MVVRDSPSSTMSATNNARGPLMAMRPKMGMRRAVPRVAGHLADDLSASHPAAGDAMNEGSTAPRKTSPAPSESRSNR
jgi:hypothetical protein